MLDMRDEQRFALAGSWRACGLREGIDLLRGDGRLCYCPVGRGTLTLDPGGALLLTNVNGAGAFLREGSWALEGGVLRLRICGERGAYRARVSGERLTLEPVRALYGCPARLLHRPTFLREPTRA